MSKLNFNASTVAPQAAFEPIPAGWYNVIIIASETKPTSDTKGAYLQLTFKVLDGTHAKRQVIARLNIKNANATAQEIAWQQLSAICHAVGVIQVEDSQQLHNRPLQIRVSVRAAQGDYDASNDVKAYRAVEGGGAAPMAGGAPTGGAPTPSWLESQKAAGGAPANPTSSGEAHTPAPAAASTNAGSDASATYPGNAPAATGATAAPAPTAGGTSDDGQIPSWAQNAG